MIRDYLYQISNIIYNNQIKCAKLRSDEKRASTKHDLHRVIRANTVLLGLIKVSAHGLADRSDRCSEQMGSGKEEHAVSMDNLDSNLKNLLNRIQGKVKEPKINKTFTNITTEITEIVEIAIVLIKFLGELIELNQDKELEQIQQQVADIVLSLKRYLD